MTDPTASCPECGEQQAIEPDEYGIFILDCDTCDARSKGEYTNRSGNVVWRWTQTADKSRDQVTYKD